MSSKARGSALSAPSDQMIEVAERSDAWPLGAGTGRMIDSALYVLILLLFLIGPQPFRDNADQGLNQSGSGGYLVVQLSFAAASLICAAYALLRRPAALLTLLRPSLFLLAGWIALSFLWSTDGANTLKRVIFAMIVLQLAATSMVLPRSIQHLSRLLGGICLFVLVVCYFGVVAIPHLAIHQTSDVIEPHLAGLWRGVFSHKNTATPTMVVFAFIGLFVARTTSRAMGWTIIALSGGFLLGAGGKTAIALAIPTLLLVELSLRARSEVVRWCLLIGPVAILNLFTVGSVIFPPVAAFNKAYQPDPSFTGRTEIWEFAVHSIAQRPWTGWGFGAFWRSDRLLRDEAVEFEDTYVHPEDTPAWVKLASHAHNGLLDSVVNLGYVGLGCVLLWVIVAPMRDIRRILKRSPPEEDGSSNLIRLHCRIWLFAMALSALEDIVFARADPMWFFMASAMFGLRLLSHFQPRAADAPEPSAASRQTTG